jgi:hypothetical protein
LAKGGFSASTAPLLLEALVRLATENEAHPAGENPYGRLFEVGGVLSGPARVQLRVNTIWMIEHLSGIPKFVTLIPVEIIRS